MTFTFTRLSDLPDDGVVTLVHAVPIPGSPGAVITFKQNDRVRCLWIWPPTGQVKLLDDDLYEQDAYKDADGIAWLAPDGKLYAVVSHAFGGDGASSRLTLGVADAPWSSIAYQALDDRIRRVSLAQTSVVDQDARDLVNAALERVQALEAELAELQATVREAGARMIRSEPAANRAVLMAGVK